MSFMALQILVCVALSLINSSALGSDGLAPLSVVHCTSMADMKRAAITVGSFMQNVQHKGIIADYFLVVPRKVFLSFKHT